jgi:putative nucleotidyltransferase with HDIG domain
MPTQKNSSKITSPEIVSPAENTPVTTTPTATTTPRKAPSTPDHSMMAEMKVIRQFIQNFSLAKTLTEQEEVLHNHLSKATPCKKSGMHLTNGGFSGLESSDLSFVTQLTATTEKNTIQSFTSHYLDMPEVPDQTCIAIAPLYTPRGYLGFIYVLDYPRARGYIQSDLSYLEETSNILALLVEGNACHRTLSQQIQKQGLLDQTLKEWQSIRSLPALYPQLLSSLQNLGAVDCVAHFLLEEDQLHISCVFSDGVNKEKLQNYHSTLGDSVVSPAFIEEKVVALNDTRLLKTLLGTSVSPAADALLLPLWEEQKVKSVLLVANLTARFETGFSSLVQQVATALGQYQEEECLHKSYEIAYDTTLEALAAMTERREQEPVGHSRRVVMYVERLAQEMGIATSEIAVLKRGALLHDVGKIGIPDTILWKPDWLSMEERQVMEQHTRYGFEMLRNIPKLHGALQIILMHHERWDGLGYPLGLAGENIPLPARIFAVADAYDAITSQRVYRQARDFEEGRRIIAMESGRQFDPQVVEAFLSIPATDWEVLQEELGLSPIEQALIPTPSLELNAGLELNTDLLLSPVEALSLSPTIPSLPPLEATVPYLEATTPHLELATETGDQAGDELVPLPPVRLVA